MQKLTEILSPDVLTRLADFSLMARFAVEGFLAGIHRSISKGPGGEFVQYRPYVPGDDLKYVDWKLYARQNRICEKVFQEETEMKCAILVDASASMAYRGKDACCSKFLYAAMLAACFANLARTQGDKPGIFVYADSVISATPNGQRTPELRTLLSVLENITPAGQTKLMDAIPQAENYLGPKRGLLILISDLWDDTERLTAITRRLRFAMRDCIVCQVLDNDEIELPFLDSRRFLDSESGASITTAPAVIRERYTADMQAFIQKTRLLCLSNQADYLLARTSEPIGDCLAAFLHRRETLLK